MKSARRKKFRAKKSGPIYGPILRIVIPVVAILGLIIFVILSTRYWNGRDKLGFTYVEKNGDVSVTVLDPKLDELTTLTIPGSTEVDVAQNYGTLQIKNVWQLSQNEKLRGKLLPETVTQNFLFPNYLWSEVNLSDRLKFVLSPGDTNIPIGDRVQMELFAMRVPSLGRTKINLGDSQFLKKAKLSDGSNGYQLNGAPSERLTIYFSDNDLSDGNLRVNIIDATGAPGVSDTVGQIIQVLGGKIVSVDKKASEATDCDVYGNNKNVVRKIATLFSCKAGNSKTDFDLEIRLGANFARRF